VLFHEFGEYRVLALELGFELLDLMVFGTLGGFGRAVGGEGEMAVLEELFEPGIELGGVKIVLIAEVGNGNLVDEMLLPALSWNSYELTAT
jgi:hypothetical protein